MSAISCTINLSVCGNSLTLCWAQSMWIYLANVYSLQRICHPLVPPSDFCHIHLGSPDTLIGSLILRLDIQKHDTVLVLFHQPRFLEKKNHDNLRREPYCTLAVWQVGQLWNGSLHEFWKFHEVCNFRSNILHWWSCFLHQAFEKCGFQSAQSNKHLAQKPTPTFRAKLRIAS